MNMLSGKRGFTLIELLVVIIIVGILASISVPIMQSTKKRAIATEAIAALGTIMTAEKLYYLEHDVFTENLQDLNDAGYLNLGPPFGTANPSDLDGLYYGNNNYYGKWWAPELGKGILFMVVCDPSRDASPPRAADSHNWTTMPGTGAGYIVLDQKGRIWSNYQELGYRAVEEPF